ncbi:MAG: hypothetical protein ACO1O1_12565 [Adhaeribacter sp.]
MKGHIEIKILEHLDPQWEDCFEGLSIRREGKLTLLQGMLKDQAQLHGILHRIWDLNLTLISVNRLE